MLSSLFVIPMIFGSYNQVSNTYNYVMTSNLPITSINNEQSFDYNSLVFKNDLSYYIEFYSDNYEYIDITQYSYISDNSTPVSFDFAKDLYQLGQLTLFDYNVSSFNVDSIISGDGLTINSFNVFNFDLALFKENNFSIAYLHYGFQISYSNGSNSLEIYDMTYSNSSLSLGCSSITNYEYENAYNNGYFDGYENGSIDSYENGYNDGVVSQETVISSLRSEINRLNGIINEYRSGNISLTDLVWDIAASPFETFKTIWNVDFLGVNIANFTLGLMLVGVVLYIWKKFV